MGQSDEHRAGMRRRILDAARTIGATGGASSTAPRLLAALCARNTEPAEISRIVGSDPGLTLRVLKVANSAFYGLSRTVSTVERAIIVLGLNAVRGIAAAACLDRTMERRNMAGLDVDSILRHSVATAAAAQAIARLRHDELTGDAFICGLLHDLGISIQLRIDDERVRDFSGLLKASAGRVSMAELLALEEDTIGVGHAEAAAITFEEWKLPPWLVEVARHHHQPLGCSPENRLLACIVHVADHLAATCGASFACELAQGPADADAVRELGISSEELDAIAANLPEAAGELHNALVA